MYELSLAAAGQWNSAENVESCAWSCLKVNALGIGARAWAA